ncbi:EAL and modified HD-GYP domain-containing signal transduction protein [Malonomonas rubra DSM 5091]|uniref:EAL and modified HD-GYP domain-containing signal transduction protein n=1 Tax=Malonomonas rubra DSM 5091 TaxID=1122189 RepID=A0A1M6I1L4_MALRU|nr:HDOD domain-containing protein [Malonomonas rubra]SHJ28382.1 EAL and modified HD-GYP domain-containing signal transduction protein [Malonomonas rubra DSM 5091]
MEHFIARQPIFDQKGKVYAYELLFRSGLHNYFDADDQDQAAASVIANSSLLFGLNEMSGGAKVFINCTHKVLVEDFMTVLPKEQAVVEVLEHVTPDAAVIDACRRLKQQGYILALDDFVYQDNWEPLLELADIIKVDFLESDREEQERLAKMMIPRGIKMLAEKVETNEVYEDAKKMGYQYFQGYFFSKPVIISRKDIPTNKIQFLRILKDIYAEDIEFQELAKTIQSEVSLSYKLLKLINSAAFALRHKVTNILQALSLLGIREIRNWVSLLSVSAMADDKPAELVVSSLVRAKFCEQMAQPCGFRGRESDMFLLGLFSLLDAIMSRPIEEILEEITIEEDVREALVGGESTMHTVLSLILAIEQGDWDQVTQLANQLGVEEQPMNEAYMDAIKWAHEIYNI